MGTAAGGFRPQTSGFRVSAAETFGRPAVGHVRAVGRPAHNGGDGPNIPAPCSREPPVSETLYIVDTFSLVFQVYHAIRAPMTGARGQPTNAVFGFTGDLEHLLKEKQPTHLMLAMESEGPQTRTEMFPAYKEHRSEMP